MRIAIPSESDQGLESIRSGHFGHAAYFTIVTIEDGKITNVESVKNVDHDEYGCGGVIEYALGLNLDALIAAGMGQPPYTRFTNGGVTVYLETQTPKVGDVVDKYLKGEVGLMNPADACRH